MAEVDGKAWGRLLRFPQPPVAMILSIHHTRVLTNIMPRYPQCAAVRFNKYSCLALDSRKRKVRSRSLQPQPMSELRRRDGRTEEHDAVLQMSFFNSQHEQVTSGRGDDEAGRGRFGACYLACCWAGEFILDESFGERTLWWTAR
jgi:hypothetical protein